MAATPVFRLTREIFNYIVEDILVSAKDFADLILTCKTAHALCKPYIRERKKYRTIYFQGADGSSDNTAANSVLPTGPCFTVVQHLLFQIIQNPRIAYYIQRLDLSSFRKGTGSLINWPKARQDWASLLDHFNTDQAKRRLLHVVSTSRHLRHLSANAELWTDCVIGDEFNYINEDDFNDRSMTELYLWPSLSLCFPI
jgi:hypothetical protein